jgi:hypothetical protein
MWLGGQRHASAALPPGMTRYPLYRMLGRPQGRSGRVLKISPPTGIRSPDRPARSESLYRLRCPGPLYSVVRSLNVFCGGCTCTWWVNVFPRRDDWCAAEVTCTFVQLRLWMTMRSFLVALVPCWTGLGPAALLTTLSDVLAVRSLWLSSWPSDVVECGRVS